MNDKKLQLFILPYAGGSIASFRRLTDLIDERIEVIPVEYAGRGVRAKEPLSSTLSEMLEDAIKYCKEYRNNSMPYAVFGYSMGTLLGYEMLVRGGLSGELKHFFVAAEVSPQTRALELRQEQNPTDEIVLKRAKDLGGLDERLLNNKRFADIYLKPMISDYKHFFEYRFNDTGKNIECDATFFYCEKDTALEDVKKWEQLITGEYDYHELGEGHFFINQEYEEIAHIVNCKLEKYL
ncbi:thioesterase II family protein [Butyrivibrio sp. AD3002]|uniref:thioesterase II family protein n=1 Tax=Butyrivibrio sp. AD3002 TaxID=1280670 RepID=UPI0018C949A7|nr:thioesterase [Butyrivibrio sp. AD3002]